MEKSVLLAEALELFAEKGYYRTTIEELSNKLGLKRADVYHLVHNKEELFSELLDAASQIREEEVFRQIGITDDFKGKLTRFVIALIRFARNHPRYYKILNLEVVSDNSEFLERVAKIQNEFHEQVYQLLCDGIRQGCFREMNPLLTKTFMAKLIEGTLDIAENNPNYSPDQVVLTMVELIWNGLERRN